MSRKSVTIFSIAAFFIATITAFLFWEQFVALIINHRIPGDESFVSYSPQYLLEIRCEFSLFVGAIAFWPSVTVLVRHGFDQHHDYKRDYFFAWIGTLAAIPVILAIRTVALHAFLEVPLRTVFSTGDPVGMIGLYHTIAFSLVLVTLYAFFGHILYNKIAHSQTQC